MNTVNQTSIKTIFLAAIAMLLLLNSSCGQNNTAGNTVQQLDNVIGKFAAYGHFNGSILVADQGQVIYQKGFGMANMEWGIPNQPDTKHRIASLTKQFTAMMVLQLVAEGSLQLDVPISTYLPDYPAQNGDQITIHQLLTHTSGTPDVPQDDQKRHQTKESVALFANAPLRFTPGDRFAYSNAGYTLLGYIVESVTGRSYAQVLKERILDPLGMNNTGCDSHSKLIQHRATGYEYDPVFGEYYNSKYIDMTVPSGAGSMYSTVEDLFLWDQALYTTKLLPEEYLNLMMKKYVIDGGGHYGYGWMIQQVAIGNTGETVESIGHGGRIDGFRSRITRIPSQQTTIILLSNTGRAALNAMTVTINAILYDQPYDPPMRPIVDPLVDILEKEGEAAAVAFFEEAKGSDTLYVSENEINLAGYGFLQSGQMAEAEAMFRLNLEAFPESFNVYDSYGEILMVMGHKSEAIKNYQKSIELNPDNKNGIMMLERLMNEQNRSD